MDKGRKKQLRHQFKKQELLDARKRLGLFPDQLRELHQVVGATLIGLGMPCDHTLTRTRRWAEKSGLDVEAVVKGLEAFGGHCDCGVLRNVTADKFGYCWE